jgi:hypothetical protein
VENSGEKCKFAGKKKMYHVELLTKEDLEHLLDVEQVLCQRR